MITVGTNVVANYGAMFADVYATITKIEGGRAYFTDREDGQVFSTPIDCIGGRKEWERNQMEGKNPIGVWVDDGIVPCK
jgi:hypothetical protein